MATLYHAKLMQNAPHGIQIYGVATADNPEVGYIATSQTTPGFRAYRFDAANEPTLLGTRGSLQEALSLFSSTDMTAAYGY